MKTTIGAVFLTSFLLYVTAAPSPPRPASNRSRLTSRDQQLLGYLLCILQGHKGCALDGDENAVDVPPPKRRESHARLEALDEEEAVPPIALSPFHAMPDRRDAFYSDWRRRK